jgi:hypothetical protein
MWQSLSFIHPDPEHPSSSALVAERLGFFIHPDPEHPSSSALVAAHLGFFIHPDPEHPSSSALVAERLAPRAPCALAFSFIHLDREHPLLLQIGSILAPRAP